MEMDEGDFSVHVFYSILDCSGVYCLWQSRKINVIIHFLLPIHYHSLVSTRTRLAHDGDRTRRYHRPPAWTLTSLRSSFCSPLSSLWSSLPVWTGRRCRGVSGASGDQADRPGRRGGRSLEDLAGCRGRWEGAARSPTLCRNCTSHID